MTLYCNPDWQPELESKQFATFEQIWNAPIEWIDAPNRNRGGWSGVGRMQFEMHGTPVTLYIKKQQNHTSRSFWHPFSGEPTFAKEFRMMRYLSQHSVVTPEVVFFAQRKNSAGQQAILITRNLDGYCGLDQINRHELPIAGQYALIAEVAKAVRQMHTAGIQHRALYTKHIFVKAQMQDYQAHDYQVAFIDFEKSRKMLLPSLQAISDLITLNYRTAGCSEPHRLYFFKKYYTCRRLSGFYKTLARWITRKSLKKQHQWKFES